MRKRKRGNRFALWMARVSALSFIILSFLLAIDDIKILLRDYPVVINFMICAVALGLLVSFWNKSRTTGILFMFLAAVFFSLNWNVFLKVDVILSSTWLFLIGILFLVSQMQIRPRRRKFVMQKMVIQYAHTVSSSIRSVRLKKPKKAPIG